MIGFARNAGLARTTFRWLNSLFAKSAPKFRGGLFQV